MRIWHGGSVLWAVACLVALATDIDVLVFCLVAPYIVLGAGLGTGVVIPAWPELRGTMVPRPVVMGVGAFATSFASSALGGQPLVWAGEWTPTRHIIATCVVSTVLFWLAMRARAVVGEPDAAEPAEPASADGVASPSTGTTHPYQVMANAYRAAGVTGGLAADDANDDADESDAS